MSAVQQSTPNTSRSKSGLEPGRTSAQRSAEVPELLIVRELSVARASARSPGASDAVSNPDPAVERHAITSRHQWLELRKVDVTASDTPALCGVDRYGTALRVWAEKTGLIAPAADSPTLRRGRWLEAAVIEAVP